MEVDLSRLSGCKVLVIGDLMIDEYLWGSVDRISPEAPVQVVSVDRENSTLGGAGNVVKNLVALGAQAAVAGVIGADNRGAMIVRMLADLNVATEGLVQDAERPTTRKMRIIGGHQHVLRIDRETTQDVSPAHVGGLVRFVEDRIHQFDILLFSDYGKGLLSEYLLQQVIGVANKRGKPVIVDPKGLSFEKYRGATAITPNKREASLAVGREILDDASLTTAGEKLLHEIRIQKLLITCGKDGMVLFEAGKKPYWIKAEVRQVFDISGAGDTVLAVLGLGIASGLSFRQAATLANIAAGIVVGKVGTATVSRDELQEALEPPVGGLVAKEKSVTDLVLLAEQLREEGKTIVMTNGCFDLLHVGHIRFLSASKEMGDVLIVAIDDDESVRMVKGKDRPVISAEQRVDIISALDCVDYVTLFSTNGLEGLIKAIRPNVLTKGSNYTTETVSGRELVEGFGGRVALIEIADPVSSSQIINQIKQGGRAD